MDKLPFSVYDFFAYLSSGAVLVAAIDYIWGLGLLAQAKLGAAMAAFLVIATYIAGHIVAHFSSLLFEQLFVHRFLKSPSELLLGSAPRARLLRWIFPNYHRPLDRIVQERIRHLASTRGCPIKSEALFQDAYPLVSATAQYQLRLDAFRNQYGFSRNVSFALLASAIALCVARRFGPNPVQLRWAAFAAIAGVSLFYRYLKFFRQYSYELLLRYSVFPLRESYDGKAATFCP